MNNLEISVMLLIGAIINIGTTYGWWLLSHIDSVLIVGYTISAILFAISWYLVVPYIRVVFFGGE